MAELNDRVALITGGGSGLGRCMALRLANDGVDVVVVGRTEQPLEATRKEIEEIGRRALSIVVDVAREDQVARMAAKTLETFGRIDILVNNAGIAGPTAAVPDVKPDDWNAVLDVNLTGPFLCCRSVLPAMIRRRTGKVINISSIVGKLAYPLRSPYAVSKWGLIGFTLTLAKEMGEYNIQVNAVCPGPVQGERIQGVIEHRAKELGQTVEQMERTFVEATVFKRFVTPEQVAAAVAFLASAEADNVTGQALDVAAGYGL